MFGLLIMTRRQACSKGCTCGRHNPQGSFPCPKCGRRMRTQGRLKRFKDGVIHRRVCMRCKTVLYTRETVIVGSLIKRALGLVRGENDGT